MRKEVIKHPGKDTQLLKASYPVRKIKANNLLYMGNWMYIGFQRFKFIITYIEDRTQLMSNDVEVLGNPIHFYIAGLPESQLALTGINYAEQYNTGYNKDLLSSINKNNN